MNLTKIDASQLSEKLSSGVTTFAFKKVGGDLRTAIGTTNLSLIPIAHHPKGTIKKERTLPFFDIEKREWRALNKLQEIYLG